MPLRSRLSAAICARRSAVNRRSGAFLHEEARHKAQAVRSEGACALARVPAEPRKTFPAREKLRGSVPYWYSSAAQPRMHLQ